MYLFDKFDNFMFIAFGKNVLLNLAKGPSTSFTCYKVANVFLILKYNEVVRWAIWETTDARLTHGQGTSTVNGQSLKSRLTHYVRGAQAKPTR